MLPYGVLTTKYYMSLEALEVLVLQGTSTCTTVHVLIGTLGTCTGTQHVHMYM